MHPIKQARDRGVVPEDLEGPLVTSLRVFAYLYNWWLQAIMF